MSSIFGKFLKISLFGESHGPAVGLTIDGLPSGIKIDTDKIEQTLAKRRPMGDISTDRIEQDEVLFLSGVLNQVTTGMPVTFIIKNSNTDSSMYSKGIVRPSHADFTYYYKYYGNNDYRGGGASSGRLTAPLVVLGCICEQILNQRGIKIGTHICQIHDVYDSNFNFENIADEIDLLNNSYFAVLNEKSGINMELEILNAKKAGDSVGGVLETAIIGLPIGLGDPYFDSLESTISHLMFSIGGIKGIEFGDGFAFADKKGSEVKDEIQYVDNDLTFLANHNGGINGGISNGQPVIFRTVVKPTPSISIPQKSIDIEKETNIELTINGRHDPCIVHRVRSVVDALCAYAIVDSLMSQESRNI